MTRYGVTVNSRPRREIVSLVKGEVLALGIETGLSFFHYISGRSPTIGVVDPCDHLLSWIVLYVEISFYSVDVMLCTIPDAEKALQETNRQLRPGEDLLFGRRQNPRGNHTRVAKIH